MEKKRVIILGSTGSIGQRTLKVISSLADKSKFEVVGLSGKDEVDLLEEQAREYRPQVVALLEGAEELRKRLKGLDIKVLSGEEGLQEVAEYSGANLALLAIVGAASLRPALAVLRSGKTLALASKEAVVMAGEILRREAEAAGVRILPVDSEPNAIFQCLEGRDPKEIKKLILTASGGAFYKRSSESLALVTPEEALQHPVWKMGPKITIDSATLMNKGLEVIEASIFFGIDIAQVEVIIHPEAKVHSLVEFVDGSLRAILGISDMSIPIQHALTYPELLPNTLPGLDLAACSPLTFEKPDTEKFPCLSYAYEAGIAGGTLPAVLNAADEVAVEAFLAGKIKFLEISKVLRKVMDKHSLVTKPTLEDIFSADEWARKEAFAAIKEGK